MIPKYFIMILFLPSMIFSAFNEANVDATEKEDIISGARILIKLSQQKMANNMALLKVLKKEQDRRRACKIQHKYYKKFMQDPNNRARKKAQWKKDRQTYLDKQRLIRAQKEES